MPRKLSQIALVAALVTTSSMMMPEHAEAQGEQVTASPKGLIGLGMIGAELGFAIPGLAGMEGAWPYIVFPIVGAAGGAVAGHFLIDNNDNENAAVAVLATGLALVVPTLVITLVGTAYDPGDEGEVEEEEGEPPPAPEQIQEEPEASRDQRELAEAAQAGAGLVRLGQRGLMLGMPGLAVVPTYTQNELSLYGGQQSTEVRLSLFTGAF